MSKTNYNNMENEDFLINRIKKLKKTGKDDRLIAKKIGISLERVKELSKRI